MSALQWVQKGRKRGQGREHDRLGRITDEVAPMVRGDVRRGLETFRDDVSPEALAEAIRTRRMDAIAKAVPWDALPAKLDKPFEKVLKAGRAAALGAVQDTTPGGEPGRTAMILDRTGPRLTSFFLDRKGVIRQATEDGTHEAVRRELMLARQQRKLPAELAENVRDVIGLTARQALAVSNFRSAISQDTRDPDTGKLVRKAPPVRQRERMVQDQVDRMLDIRADNIARTELRFATNEAQTEAWRAAAEEELILPSSGRRWLVDGRPCKDLCVPMHGVVVDLDEPWVLPDGREVDNPSESHPCCECVSQLVMDR